MFRLDSPFAQKRRHTGIVGRPPVHQESWAKVTVILLNRQVVFLDRMLAGIRAATGTAVHRAEIIRALIDFLAESGIDLSDVRSEAQLKETLSRRPPRPRVPALP
jgi:hypothetical protein